MVVLSIQMLGEMINVTDISGKNKRESGWEGDGPSSTVGAGLERVKRGIVGRQGGPREAGEN